MNDEIKEILSLLNSSSWGNEAKQIEDYIINLQEQLHQASLDIQELTERDIECPSWCDKLTNLQQKYDRALEDSVKETHKLMAIRKYLKDNEREYGSLEDNEKIILGIIEGKY